MKTMAILTVISIVLILAGGAGYWMGVQDKTAEKQRIISWYWDKLDQCYGYGAYSGERPDTLGEYKEGKIISVYFSKHWENIRKGYFPDPYLNTLRQKPPRMPRISEPNYDTLQKPINRIHYWWSDTTTKK